jgi:hypothetical protein
MRNKASTSPHNGGLQQTRTFPGKPSFLALCVALAFSAVAPITHAAQADAPALPNQRAAAHWQDLVLPAEAASTAKTKAGAGTARVGSGASARTPALKLKRLRGATLDLSGMRAHAAGAPAERSSRALASPLTVSLPHPDGGYQRFTLIESSLMEPELAAKHPEIKTYKGQGIDDPNATMRMDVTPMGLHASVRSPRGGYYVDPYYKDDDSVYASYSRADLVNEHGPLIEGDTGEAQLILSRSFYKEGDTVEVRGAGFAPSASVDLTLRSEGDSAVLQTVTATADKDGAITVALQPGASGSFEVTASSGATSSAAAFQVIDAAASPDAIAGGQLRTYRLALVTDPSYATYFGGPANVTAAKVTLINRVTQVYEDETSIRLVLINATDRLNLNTAAEMTGANGPCGGSACYTATQASTCGSSLLSRNRIVTGLLAGAGSFDVGHIALGVDGGGIASLGVVGLNGKSQGCTGLPMPVGDFFAVDYVAHELGHQFAGNHTFNGVVSNCASTNRNPGTSVEVGSGSSIMAYAGICGTDNLQNHSDPYWSQRSFDEITAHTSAAESTLNEVQMGVLTGFSTNGQQFQIGYKGNLSAPIVRGTNFTVAGIKAAIEGIAGWPAGATVTASADAHRLQRRLLGLYQRHHRRRLDHAPRQRCGDRQHGAERRGADPVHDPGPYPVRAVGRGDRRRRRPDHLYVGAERPRSRDRYWTDQQYQAQWSAVPPVRHPRRRHFGRDARIRLARRKPHDEQSDACVPRHGANSVEQHQRADWRLPDGAGDADGSRHRVLLGVPADGGLCWLRRRQRVAAFAELQADGA